MQAFEPSPPPLKEDADGVLRVAGTRVTLSSVVIAFDMGATAEEIAQQYPSLDLTSVYEVIAFVLRNRSFVDEYMAARDKASEETRSDLEHRFPAEGLRARLLARDSASPDRTS